MPLHPCLGKDLRSATILTAFVDIVWTSIFIAIAIVIIISSATTFIFTHQVAGTNNNASSSQTPVVQEGSDLDVTKIALGGLIVGTIILVVKILQLLLAVYLLQGAKERNPHRCRVWIYITCVFVIITVMNFVFDVVSVEGSKVGSYISLIGIFLHVYFLWVVSSFKQELERSRAQPEVDATGLKA